MEKSRKMAEQDVERLQRRADAEKADLRATASRLEVDLMKVSSSTTHPSWWSGSKLMPSLFAGEQSQGAGIAGPAWRIRLQVFRARCTSEERQGKAGRS